MSLFGRACQSCGMPLARDEKGGGTEKNGSLSSEYCSHCYQQGQFTEPALSVDQMIAKVRDKMKARGLPDFLAAFLTRNTPRLKRWAAGS